VATNKSLELTDGALNLSQGSGSTTPVQGGTGESQQMFKELFQTGNKSFGKDKGIAGITGVQVHVTAAKKE